MKFSGRSQFLAPILAFAATLSVSALAETALPATAVIWNVATGEKIQPGALLSELEDRDQLVLGETHSDGDVQRAEAWLLENFAKASSRPTTFAWEFLNWSERESVEKAYADWKNAAITDDELLGRLFGKPGSLATYLHPLRVARDLQLPLLPTNLTRAEKSLVVQGGLSAADPALIPLGFELGGAAYRERFIEAMGGHGDPAVLENYFAAQCLTDDVVADHLMRDLRTPRSVLIIGNFHTAYFDGTWKRLERREPKLSRVLVHLEKTEASLSDEEQKKFLQDERHGPIAHFVIFF